ncbi:MAG: M1 family metallopeptidase [Gemmatimonadales bacterium]|jgi:hypothetical protein
MGRIPGAGIRFGRIAAGFTAALMTLALPAAAGAQETPVTMGDGLISDTPVFEPVQPPAGYVRAVDEGTRTPDGRPGPKYWQQSVDYAIDVSLDPATARITGSETATIHNRAPVPLPVILVRLYQNVFSEGVERNRQVELTGGMTIDRVAVNGVELEDLTDDPDATQRDPGYRIIDTRMVVVPPDAVTPGSTTDVDVDWSFTVSGGGGFRNGHLDHEIYNIAQWYPQITVFDDVFGLDTDAYLGDGEFYVDYGDFDVNIDVPEGWVVVGTGELENPSDVLRPEQAETLAGAAELDTVVYVVSPADVEAGRTTRASDTGRLTWRFHAANVRDFAWATSNRYAWNVTGAETGGEQGRALIQGVFPPESETWAQAAGFAKHAIEFYGDYLLPYPYPHATAAFGPPQVGGMEYPMITFINDRDEPASLNGVVSHELSHFWVPMIVGTKENAYAWMDEGFTTYNTALAMADYYGEDSPQGRSRNGDMRNYLNAVQAGVEVPIMRHTDYAENGFGRSIAAYSKPGMLMHTLRHMMGTESFDAAYRDYIDTWKYKHPMPWDFFRMMEEAAGTDLDWFWQAWYYDTATLDQAIGSVETTADGLEITVRNQSDAVMPVELQVTLADGSTETFVWPVDVWAGTREVTRTLPVDGQVEKIVIDPDAWYPDTDRTNNSWERPAG